MRTLDTPPSPPAEVIEVWLTRQEMGITCTAYKTDEHQYDTWRIDSLSVRGAMREITAHLLEQGWAAIGRWETVSVDRDNNAVEASRRFRQSTEAKA